MNNNEKVPDFLIIGAMKSGTTNLYDDLKTSSYLSLPHDKEPAILLKANSRKDAIKKYRLHFKGSSIETLRGEGSTYYMMQPLFPDVSKFAKDVCGKDLKLIAILRDPIDRIVSHVTHDYVAGRLKYRDVDYAIEKDSRYIDFSNYSMQLKPWIDSFGLENLHCISFKQYVANCYKASRRAAVFLGVDPNSLTHRKKISNKSLDMKKNIMTPQIMGTYNRYLRSFFPCSLKKLGMNIVTRKLEIPEIQFSMNLKSDLIIQFSQLNNELHNLIGEELEW